MRLLLWTLIWVVLVAGAAWWLWRGLRDLWGRSTALGAQLAEAETLLAATELVVRQHADADAAARAAQPAPELAVFGNPLELAGERTELRRSLREQRDRRRAERLPGWARHGQPPSQPQGVESADADHRKA